MIDVTIKTRLNFNSFQSLMHTGFSSRTLNSLQFAIVLHLSKKAKTIIYVPAPLPAIELFDSNQQRIIHKKIFRRFFCINFSLKNDNKNSVILLKRSSSSYSGGMPHRVIFAGNSRIFLRIREAIIKIKLIGLFVVHQLGGGHEERY